MYLSTEESAEREGAKALGVLAGHRVDVGDVDLFPEYNTLR
jgi:hypothetical protein